MYCNVILEKQTDLEETKTKERHKRLWGVGSGVSHFNVSIACLVHRHCFQYIRSSQNDSFTGLSAIKYHK